MPRAAIRRAGAPGRWPSRPSNATPRSSSGCATPARCWWQSSRPASWRSAISGRAAAPTTRGTWSRDRVDRPRDPPRPPPPAWWRSRSDPTPAARFFPRPCAAGSSGCGRPSAASAAHGVMTAGSTLDKIGPMCRHAQDCMIVLHAIAGPDVRDRAVPDAMPISWDATRGRYPRRVGYVPALLDGRDQCRPARQRRPRAGRAQTARLHAGATRCVPERRSLLLHRIHGALGGVRLADRDGSPQRRQPAERTVTCAPASS